MRNAIFIGTGMFKMLLHKPLSGSPESVLKCNSTKTTQIIIKNQIMTRTFVRMMGLCLILCLSMFSLHAQWSWDLEIPEAASPPVIDGDGSDAAWDAMTSFQPISNHIDGEIDDPTDFSAEFKAVWAGDTLYLLVNVTDDVPFTGNPDDWQNDNIEVFLDLDNSKNPDPLDPPPNYDGNDFQIMCPYNGAANHGGVTIANSGNTSGSYTMEIKIELEPFGGYLQDAIGFDLQIDDCDGDGTREAALCWHSTNNQNWLAPEYFGTASWTDRGNAIYEFGLTDGQRGEVSFFEAADSIYLEVSFGTNLATLSSEFFVSSGASVETTNEGTLESGVTEVDFSSSPVTYTVTSGNGDSRDWKVHVVEATASTENEILSSVVGILSDVQDSIYHIGQGVTAQTLMDGLTLSDYASVEILDGPGGSPVVGTTVLTSIMVAAVTAEDGTTTSEYKLNVEAPLLISEVDLHDEYWRTGDPDFWDTIPVSGYLNYFSEGPVVPDDDISGEFKIVSDTSNLFIHFSITDEFIIDWWDSPDMTDDDCVELLFDADNAKSSAYADDIRILLRGWEVGYPEGQEANVEVDIYKWDNEGSRYYAMLRIPFSDLGITQGTTLAGFDIVVNDDDDWGERDNRRAWFDSLNFNQTVPAVFGTIEFEATITASNRNFITHSDYGVPVTDPDSLVGVPSGTTVGELRSGLAVSGLASFEIYQSDGVTVPAEDAAVAKGMLIEVTAENGDVRVYGISETLDGTKCENAIIVDLGINHANNQYGLEQWFVYTAAEDTAITVSTCGLTSKDTYLEVYTDCSGSMIAQDDDACDLQSKVTIEVAASQPYYIAWKPRYTNGEYDWALEYAAPEINVQWPHQKVFLSPNTEHGIDFEAILVDAVDIELSIDGGLTWETIVTDYPVGMGGNNYWPWTTPDVTGDHFNCYIRITNSNDGSIVDLSDVFSISDGSPLRVVEPNGGESYKAGNDITVSMVNYGQIHTWVDVDVSYNKGETWENVAGDWMGDESSKSMTFAPDSYFDGSDTCLVRCWYERWGDTFGDTSDAVFTILPRPAEITDIFTPGDGDYLVSDDVIDLHFETFRTDSVDIHYSLDGGATWTIIYDDEHISEGSNALSWTIPTITGTNSNARVKVTNAGDASVYKVSSLFTIAGDPPSITLVNPAGGEQITIGGEYIIEFEVSGPGTKVYVYYSSDGTTQDEQIGWSGFDATPGTNTVTWNIDINEYGPDPDAYIIITSDDGDDVNDTPFELVEPAPSLSAYAPWYPWVEGNPGRVQWESTSIDEVNIDLSLDGGSTWSNLEMNVPSVNGNNGHHVVAPTVDSTMNNCKLRLTSVADPGMFSITSSFTIMKDYPAIELLSPNTGDEEYFIDEDMSIRTYNPDEQIIVNAQLSADGGNNWFNWTSLSINNDTAVNIRTIYSWLEGSGLTESTDYLLRLVDQSSGHAYDTSDNVFSIQYAPELILYADYEGETFVDHDWPWIEFELRKVDDITVEVSVDGGATWIHIKDEYFGDGHHGTNVELPDVDGTKTNCYIRVSNSVDPDMHEVTGPFTITDGDNPPTITMIEPLAEAVYNIGEEVPIVYETDQWVDVDILFSDNDGLTWEEIRNWYWSEPGTNTYYWTPDVDQTPSANCRIMTRVSWDDSNRDTSDVFELVEPIPSISVATPEQDEFLVSGEQVLIEWEGLIVSEVNIDYSSDLGSTWTPVVSGIPSEDGSNIYFWTVADPGMYSENCMIRISDASDATVYGESEVFTISPDPVGIAVVDPNGGESFVFYESTTIEFNYNGLDTWVDINLSPDSGSTWYDVDEMEAVRGLNQYEWDIYKNYTQTGTWNNHKLSAGDRFQIRIRKQDAPHIKDLSDDVFTIVDPPSSIDVMEPTSDARWLIGDEGEIAYGVASVDSVDIHYSVDGGATWVQMADNVMTQPEYNTYLWNIPADLTPTTNAKIKVVNSDNKTVVAVSDAFTLTDVPPSITVLSPNGGETWTIGSTQTVEFELDAGATYISVSVSYDNGNNWHTVDSWTWTETGINTVEIETIDLEPSAQALIRVDDYFSSLNDESDGVFNIAEPPVELTMDAPVDGDIYFTGENISLEWYSYNVDNVTLVLMEGGVSTGDTLAKSALSQDGDNFYTTPVESSMVGGSYQVKIYDAGDPSLSDLSGSFSVQEFDPSITIVAPNGGEAFTQGDGFDFEFNNDGPEQAVIVSYSEDNGTTWEIMDEVTAETGYNSISMMIPADATPVTTALMKVRYKLDATVADVSNNPFTVLEAVTNLTLISPEEGLYLANGNNVSIDWTSINVDNVTLTYSTDGSTWSNIATGINAALGSYNWTVSGIDNVYAGSSIKIEDASDATLSDAVGVILSDVSNTITVDAPNGGETFNAGDQMNVEYTNIGNATTVKVSISMNNGSSWMLLSDDNASANGSNTIVVNIPLTITGSTNCLVKVTDEQDAGNMDVSNNVFTVQEVTESITVDNPMTDDQWLAGEQYAITWSSVGVDNVDIEYTTNAGSTWNAIVSSIFSTNGDENTYNWTVPDPGSNETAQVRISNSADNTINDLSGEFAIVSEPQGIAISEPNGAENYLYGEDVDITFTLQGIDANVAIAVSDDNGTSWSTLTGAFEAVVGENIYTWTPTEVSDQYLVRVRLANDFDVADTSDATFAVNPSTNALLSELRYGGTLFTGLIDGTYEYVITLPAGTMNPPVVSAVAQSDYATIGYMQAVAIDDTALVVVTAQDGSTSNTYEIDFVVPATPSTDATLSSIVINGTPLQGFASGTYSYDVVLPEGTTNTPVVTAVTSNSYATKSITQPASTGGTATIVVTAEDETTELTYTVNFSVYVPSGDATLASLSVDGTAVTGFDAATLAYTVEHPYATTDISVVDAVANDDSTTVDITQATTVDGSATVVVTAEDGSRQTYTVDFTIAAPSTDATLSDLTVGGTTVTGFDAATLTYNVELPAGTTTAPAIDGVLNDNTASMDATQAVDVPGNATIVVTAQDGSTTNTYTVNFSVAVGINEAITRYIKVYPNPATKFFYINNPDMNVKKAFIFTSSGQLVKSIETVDTDVIEFNSSSFAQGSYQILLQLVDGSVINKEILIIR